MSTLFPSDNELEVLPVDGADISYLERLDLGLPADELLSDLIENVRWRAESITVWGKTHPQPRLIAWYGDAGRAYRYSGIQLAPLPWNSLLEQVRDRVELVAKSKFNSVLLNYYRDHRDGMGFHSDDEPELGSRPVIASLSLGETRTFVLKSKAKDGRSSVRIPLEPGSLLIMKGDTQLNWMHGIEKLTRPCGPRVNLTFRRILESPFK